MSVDIPHYLSGSTPLRSGASDEELLREVSHAAADVGISPEDAEAGEIARRLAEVELGR